MDKLNNNIVNNEVKNKKKINWRKLILILIVLVPIIISYIPIYVDTGVNYAWGYYRRVSVITLNGAIVEVTLSKDDNYIAHDRISIDEWSKLMTSSFIIDKQLVSSGNDFIVFDAGTEKEYALNLLKLSYIKIYEGPSYSVFNPTANAFSDMADELFKTYIR